MSRIGKSPIALPKGVDVTIAQDQVSVKGPLGTMSQRLSNSVRLEKSGEELVFSAVDSSSQANALSGTMRALVANMVTGVTKGFERKLNPGGCGIPGAGAGRQAQSGPGFLASGGSPDAEGNQG